MQIKANLGFSLLELLISLVIFSFALLGLAKLSMQAMLVNHSAYLYNVANQQAAAVTELFQLTNNYSEWQNHLKKLLPAGEVQVRSQGKFKYIQIRWHDKFHIQSNRLALTDLHLITNKHL